MAADPGRGPARRLLGREPDTGMLQGGSMQTRVAYLDNRPLAGQFPTAPRSSPRPTARLRLTRRRRSATRCAVRSPAHRCGSG